MREQVSVAVADGGAAPGVVAVLFDDGAGFVDDGVYTAEMVGQVKRLMKGIDASPGMIAEDLVKQVGHRGRAN